MRTDSTTLDIVRQRIGRRHKITRREMADILSALTAAGLDLRNDYVARTLDLSAPRDPEHGYPQAPAAHEVWANACTGITCISVDGQGRTRDGNVRYDSPGGMNPTQYAELLFAPAELGDYEYDQIGQLRRHADRVLIVDGPKLAAPVAPPRLAHGVTQSRKLEWMDGVYIRVTDDGMLEMRDPNDGQSPDPRDKARHQYRIDDDGDILYRRLPPESVGDAWLDTGVPEWEPYTTPPTNDLIYRWWEERIM